MKNDYFKPRDIIMSLCQCDIDIFMYAIYHVDWSEYDDEDFGGEGIEAACIHLDDIECQLEEAKED